MISAPFLLQCLTVFPALAEEFSSSYSPASYYASLGLFVISIPGLYSLIKRATKSKIVRKTFEVPGPAEPGAKPLSVLAGEITAFLQRNNYKVIDMKDAVTFEGKLEPSRSQAAFLVFCTALSLASVALVLTITNPEIGEMVVFPHRHLTPCRRLLLEEIKPDGADASEDGNIR
ncbi:hypothetical protein CLOM_g16974 [Closterium sp. NIES-68]|nr:hypothetical protein CLOM_g16974 [Closterium sp. NIES-68]